MSLPDGIDVNLTCVIEADGLRTQRLTGCDLGQVTQDMDMDPELQMCLC